MFRAERENYDMFYARLTEPVRRHPGLVRAIAAANHLLTYPMYAAYPLLLIWLLVRQDDRFWRILLVPGISFCAVSVARRMINRTRPYERWNISGIIKKDKKGESMPSRHVFASVIISMAFLHVCVPIGVVLLIISCFTAAVRILGGVHYPSDVLAGFAIGVVAGLLI